MRKIFISILILVLILPVGLFAQSSILDQLPKNVKDTLNANPGATQELQNIYNTNLNIGNTGVQEQLSFSLTPSVPRPNQLVSAKIASYSVDLNRLQISWYLNGELVKRAIGENVFEFQMGDIGKITRLRVVITKSDGSTLEKNYSFRPAEVDLIYEAQTHTPPFYQGQAYFTKQSDLKITAMPQVLNSAGNLIKPENIIYKWYLDGSVVQNQSGYGKQNFFYGGKLLDSNVRVGVEISTIEDGAVANTSINIDSQNPEVIIYEKNPILGTLYNNIVSNLFQINIPEIEFEAVPYFFKKDSVLNKSTAYDWKLNGSKINSPNTNSLVFRNEKNQKGQANIGISISNETILQKASNNFKLNFGEQTNDFQF
jgi:hypothetical protein